MSDAEVTENKRVDKSRNGLHHKYEVYKDGEPVEDCFVLRPKSDPDARVALFTYARIIDDEKLRTDLMEWLGGFWD